MYGSSSSGSGTLSQGSVLDWSTYHITVEPSAVSAHMTFQLLRNGSVYSSKLFFGNKHNRHERVVFFPCDR